MRATTKKFVFDYEQFPSCCVAGLACNFTQLGGSPTKEEKQEVWNLLEQRMGTHSVTIMMDVEGGPGFNMFHDSPKVIFLSSTFNKNSGNTVYTMQYTK